MKPSFQLNIESPCHEKWDSFAPTATGGFCASCQKNVIDFSQMSESQLVAFFRDHQSSSQNLCGRFREDQFKKKYDIEEWFPTWRIENDELQYEIPVAAIAQKKYTQAISLPLIQQMKVVRNMAAAVLTLLCIEGGVGQNRIISGKIIDADYKEALSGVSIYVKGAKQGTVSDINGNYKIEVSANDTLVFSAIGFKPIEKKATTFKKFAKIKMKEEGTVMGEVAFVERDDHYKIEVMEVPTYEPLAFNAISFKPIETKVPTFKDFAKIEMKEEGMVLGGVGLVGRDVSTSAESSNHYGFDKTENLKKYATKITVRGNAVQNGELILVPELVASKDSTGNSFERINDEKWFRENGFQQITSVQLYDYSGRIFNEQFIKLSDGMISVDVRGLPQGTYVVRAVYKNERSLAENEISTVRVLIER